VEAMDMSIGMVIGLIVLFIAAILGTFYAFKQEERQMKQYEDEGVTVEEELRRSNEYEKSSLKTSLPVQVWIYVIAIGISLIAFAIYLF
jgi:cbb3-type cytochrome oxidase subunit 3